MEPYLNRRQWLKTGAAAAAGLFIGGDVASLRSPVSGVNRAVVAEDFIRLNNNESPLGLSPQAKAAAAQALEAGHRYPHRRYPELKELIAEGEGLSPDNIVLGAGSTEIMTMLIQGFGAQGDILTADPTYFDFVYYAKNAGCRLQQVALDHEFKHDLAAMAEQITAQTRLVYICNPSNPTGTIVSSDNLAEFCASASRRSLVVVDEAYHEYVESPDYRSMTGRIKSGENVVVTRTFSKIFGQAGMRIGYGMAGTALIRELKRIQRNFATVAYPSLMAAVAGYQDTAFTRLVRNENRKAKAFLHAELERMKLPSIPSHTNFVLFRIDRGLEEAVAFFRERRILIRAFPIKAGAWLRVSLGTLPEMKAFVTALAEMIRA